MRRGGNKWRADLAWVSLHLELGRGSVAVEIMRG